jgi:hypothetical protein
MDLQVLTFNALLARHHALPALPRLTPASHALLDSSWELSVSHNAQPVTQLTTKDASAAIQDVKNARLQKPLAVFSAKALLSS